ncbi:hypothetical protein LTR84_011745 [Exophiala bonariae]|uniref:Uncharacterized protein n=1 Tax=Exophiala bonariae TaxID=1690606 RepID=A0AAV9NKH9_9EURO|nr:hypothetical protein LTR84_011745 [Exophiala bonariae]
MKITAFFSVLIASIWSATLVLGLDAADRENLIAALIARDIPHGAALDLVNLFPRHEVTTVTVTQCETGYTSIPTPSISTTDIPFTSIESTTQTTSTATIPVTTETASVNTETTASVGSSSTPATLTTGSSSVPLTSSSVPGSSLPVTSSTGTTTHTTSSTATTHTTATTSTASTPPAVPNAGTSKHTNAGLLGLMAVLALA